MRILLVLFLTGHPALASHSYEASAERTVSEQNALVVGSVDKIKGFSSTVAKGPTGTPGFNPDHTNLVFETKAKGKTLGFQVMTTRYNDDPLFWFDDAAKGGKKTALVPDATGFKLVSPQEGESTRQMQQRLFRAGSAVTSSGANTELLAMTNDAAIFRSEHHAGGYRWLTLTVLRRQGATVRMQRFLFRDTTAEQAQQIFESIQSHFDVSRGVSLLPAR